MCVTSLLCGPGPIYGRFTGFYVNGFLLACENIRFSSLVAAGEVSRGEKEERGETDVFAG